MENLDIQVRDVYAEYGCVMGEIQLIERYLVYLILAGYDAPANQTLTREEFDGLLSKLSRETLGGLVHRLKRSFDVPPTFESRLAEALRLRNWLVHHYFADRADAFQTEAGRTEMIRELDEIGDLLHKLYEFLDDFLTGWLVQPGASTRELVECFGRSAREA